MTARAGRAAPGPPRPAKPSAGVGRQVGGAGGGRVCPSSSGRRRRRGSRPRSGRPTERESGAAGGAAGPAWPARPRGRRRTGRVESRTWTAPSPWT